MATFSTIRSPNSHQFTSRASDYRREREIGRGSFAVVYKARHTPTNRVVAVKEIDLEDVQRKGLKMERINKEIEIQTRVSHTKHPGIVQLYHHFQDDNTNKMYLISEYVNGGELFKHLKELPERRVSEEEAFNFLEQLVDILDYLHSRMIIHRDLKLQNILLTESKRLKLCDFGLTVRLEGPDLNRRTWVGTPNYMSPEMIDQLTHNVQTDIWSLGCVFYALLVGRPPFESHHYQDTLEKAKQSRYEDPVNVSADARDLIRQFLTIDPKRRITLDGVRNHPWYLRHHQNLHAMEGNDDMPRRLFRSHGSPPSLAGIDEENECNDDVMTTKSSFLGIRNDDGASSTSSLSPRNFGFDTHESPVLSYGDVAEDGGGRGNNTSTTSSIPRIRCTISDTSRVYTSTEAPAQDIGRRPSSKSKWRSSHHNQQHRRHPNFEQQHQQMEVENEPRRRRHRYENEHDRHNPSSRRHRARSPSASSVSSGSSSGSASSCGSASSYCGWKDRREGGGHRSQYSTLSLDEPLPLIDTRHLPAISKQFKNNRYSFTIDDRHDAYLHGDGFVLRVTDGGESIHHNLTGNDRSTVVSSSSMDRRSEKVYTRMNLPKRLHKVYMSVHKLVELLRGNVVKIEMTTRDDVLVKMMLRDDIVIHFGQSIYGYILGSKPDVLTLVHTANKNEKSFVKDLMDFNGPKVECRTSKRGRDRHMEITYYENGRSSTSAAHIPNSSPLYDAKHRAKLALDLVDILQSYVRDSSVLEKYGQDFPIRLLYEGQNADGSVISVVPSRSAHSSPARRSHRSRRREKRSPRRSQSPPIVAADSDCGGDDHKMVEEQKESEKENSDLHLSSHNILPNSGGRRYADEHFEKMEELDGHDCTETRGNSALKLGVDGSKCGWKMIIPHLRRKLTHPEMGTVEQHESGVKTFNLSDGFVWISPSEESLFEAAARRFQPRKWMYRLPAETLFGEISVEAIRSDPRLLDSFQMCLRLQQYYLQHFRDIR